VHFLRLMCRCGRGCCDGYSFPERLCRHRRIYFPFFRPFLLLPLPLKRGRLSSLSPICSHSAYSMGSAVYPFFGLVVCTRRFTLFSPPWVSRAGPARDPLSPFAPASRPSLGLGLQRNAQARSARRVGIYLFPYSFFFFSGYVVPDPSLRTPLFDRRLTSLVIPRSSAVLFRPTLTSIILPNS